MPEYSDQIEGFLSEKIQKPVAIASFASRWEGLDPVLDINGLSIHGHEPFYIGRVRFQFAFWSSVLSLSPKFERVLIEQAELTFKQHDDGRWFVLIDDLNIDPAENQNTTGDETYQSLIAYLTLFNGTTLNLKDLNANIYKHNGAQRNLRLPNLNLNYKNDQFFASGQVLESQGQKALLNFSLAGRGLFSNDAIKGTLYVEARSSEFFGELLSIYDWQKLSIQSVEASSRAWINFENMQVSSVYGDVQVSEINWKMSEKSLPPINDLAFSYFWKGNAQEQTLSLADLGFEWAGLNCDPGDIRVLLKDSDLLIQAEKLNVQCANRLALSLDMASEKLNSRLYQSNPKGFLRNIHLTLHQGEESKQRPDQQASQLDSDILSESLETDTAKTHSRFTFEALLDHVSINAYESTPSGKNLSGYIFVDNDSGYVSFLSEHFELGFPKLFLEPWELSLAEGRVHWDINTDDMTIYSEGLRLWREEQSLIYGDFILRLNPADQEDYLALSIGMQDILFNDAVKFVPFYEVEEGLYNWLSESLVSGLVSNGVYYGYGSVEAVHQENSFTSSLALFSEKGELKFDPVWPALEQLDAAILLQNGQLAIDAERASMAKSVLTNISAFLPEGKPGQANFLSISAQSNLENEAIHYWLSESPIAESTRPIAEQLLIDATANARIELEIPVQQAEKPEQHADMVYRVNVNLNDAAIDHPDSNLSFTKVQGSLLIDSINGVNADDVTLRVFDKPAKLAIKTEYHNGHVKNGRNANAKTTLTRLFLDGSLAMDSVFQYLKQEKPTALSGDVHYAARLTLSDQDKQHPMLRIESDLLGMRCQCPAPFTKTEKQRASLNLSLLLKPDQTYLEGRLNSAYMPEIKTELLLVEAKPSFGEVLIGGAKVSNTQIKGLNIAAKLKKVNLKNWVDFLSENLLSDPPDNTEVPIKALAEQAVPTENGFLKQIQLDIETLDAFDYLLPKTTLKLAPDPSGQWHIGVSGKDISGRISLATENKPLSLDLNTLNLISADAKTVSHIPSKKAAIDPRTFPEINFKTANLLLNGRSIGNWQFDLQPDEQGSIFRNLKGYFKGSNISGQVNWRYETDTQRTIATLLIEGKDVMSIFDMLTLPPLINSERYTSDISLVWPAAPYDFSLSTLSGKIALDLESGFIQTEDEKTGALRLFGILNAESIKRRLKLDFSDLYKSGIGYDTIKGLATIDNGLLTLSNTLEIEGPAGKYMINGRSDLATKALDFDMLVELPFSQNFPLAALVLGAPQVGGLVWVADKLLGEPLSALTTSRYDISGTWEQPRVDLHQAVNASKKDRSKEKGMRDANH